MSDESAVKLDVRPNGVAVITIDVPGSKVNTLSRNSMTELNAIIDDLTRRADKIKGVLLQSGKADNFVAGADVVEISKIQDQSQVDAYEASQLGKEVFGKLSKLPRTVAMINGTCLGGGTEMVLACQYRVALESAKIGLPEVMLGFIPGWGGCVRLPKVVGLQKAIELIMSGKNLDGKRAWKANLVDEVVAEHEQLHNRAEAIALGDSPRRFSRPIDQTLLAAALETNPIGRNVIRNAAYKAMMKQTKGKYPAPKEALNLLLKTCTLDEPAAFEQESRVFSRLAMTDVSRNLVGVFFAQQESKKMPAESGSRPEIKTVGVLGAGVMGAGIAQGLAKAGYCVVLKDVEQRFLDKGMETIRGLFDEMVKKKRMKSEEAQKIVDGIKTTIDYADLKDCDLVIEAVLEILKVKQEVLSECETAIGRDFIFASNTSSLSVSEIGALAKNPANVVGLHFFNPVHKMPLVEVVKAKQTSDETLSAAMAVALKLGKTTVITRDAPGFVVNRILAPYMRESAVLVESGTPIPDIDKAMKSFGMPMGPLELLDEVGLDIAAKVGHVMYEAFGERLKPPALMQEIEESKLLGKKGGKGIYLYDERKKPSEVNPEVLAKIKAAPHPRLPGDIQDRLVLLMLNEAARCLEEGIVAEPSQLDLAMIFGTGFPPFLGGILKYADSTGIAIILEELDYLSRTVAPYYAPCDLIRQLAEQKRTFYRSRKSLLAESQDKPSQVR